MKKEELLYINKIKQEFEEKFSRKLIIDFVSMNENDYNPTDVSIDFFDRKDLVDQHFQKCIDKYTPNLEKLKTTRIHKLGMRQEEKFMADFCRYVMRNQLSPGYAATLIGKDKATVFYHGKYKDAKKTGY